MSTEEDDQRRRAAPSAREGRTRTHATLLDGQVVRRRRLTIGLDLSNLAAALGVTGQVVNRLEHGSRQNPLTVSFIVDLAHALGLDPVDLIEPPAPTTPGDLVDTTDAATAGSILAETAGWADIDDLTDALDWTLGRTLVALDALDAALCASGQRLAWLADREVRIVGKATERHAVAKVTGRHIERRGVTRDEAMTLHLLVEGRSRAPVAALGPAMRMSLARLGAAELIQTDVPVHDQYQQTKLEGDEKLRLSDDARFNLCIDD